MCPFRARDRIRRVIDAPLAALGCAIPLALACGSRAPEPEARRFEARIEFPTESFAKPQGVLCADLDGDARDEVIFTTIAPPTVQILAKLARDLGPAPVARAFPCGDFALGPVWVDRDARLVAIAPRDVPGLVVFDARKTFASSGSQLAIEWKHALPTRPRVLAAGRVGDVPMVAVVTIDDELVLVRGADREVRIKLENTLASCASFDGSDLYIGFQGTRRVVRYGLVNSGEKLFTKQWAELDGLPRALEVSDLDGDGARELVVAGGDDHVWTFAIASGALEPMEFKARESFAASEVPIDLERGELDGTPPEEVVAIGMHGQNAHVVAHSERMSKVYAGQHPRDGALGDVDGDEKLDLVLANPDAQRISVLFGSGDARRFVAAERARSGRSPHSLACADVDGDGDLDVVALNALEATAAVLRNEGGKLQDGRVEAYTPSGDAVRCADVDGDGNVDALLLERDEQGSKIVALFGDGAGRLVARALVEPARCGDSAGDLLVGDFDGDGKLEAIASDPEKNRVALVPIERTADGMRFGKALSIDVAAGPNRMARIDLDRDGTGEIAVALAGPGTRLGVAFLGVTRNGDVLSLVEVQHIPFPDPSTGIATADFDGDGRTDLAVLAQASESSTTVRVGLATEKGAWMPVKPMRTGLRPYALRAGDLDGDGRADLVVSAQNSHHIECWLARAGSTFEFVRTADLGAGTGCLDVQLADLDGDGKLEILVANAFSDDVTTIRVK